MFGIGETELVIIVVFGFLLFGPDKLPGMGRTIGRALRQFREAQEGFQQVVQAEVMDPLNDAMNAPAKKAAQSAIDDDSDIEGSDAEVAGRKAETFAERKARLQAERKAKEDAERKAKEEAEQAAAEAAEQAAEISAPDTDEDADLPESEPTPQEAPVEAEEAPAANSVAALYAMAPRKRAAKAEPDSEPEPTVTAEPAEASAETPQTDEQGKEDGSEA